MHAVQWPPVKRRLFTILIALSLLHMASCRRESTVPPAGPNGPSQIAPDVPSPVEKPPATAPTTRPGYGSATAHGITLSVTMPPTSRLGSAIPAEVVLHNGSGVPIEYRDMRPEDYVFALRAVDAAGRDVRRGLSPFLSAGPGRLEAGD